MTLEKQVTSLELSKQLKKLGVKQESLFWWSPYVEIGGSGKPTYKLDYRTGIVSNRERRYSAFTVAELGEILGKHFHKQELWNQGKGKKWMVEGGEEKSNNYEYETKRVFADTEAEARGLCLVYLLENGLLKL